MDNSGNQALRDLGIFYCSAYVVSLAACSLAWWLYWDAWRLDSLLPDMAIITTVSAGVALLATILKEAGTYMVLAAMKARQLKAEGIEQGIKQGIEQGIEQERKRRRKRQEEARAKFGVEVDGVLMLPQTPEVERFMAEEDEQESEK